MAKVTIYTKPFCGYCERAKWLLTTLGARFEEIDLSSDPELAESLSAQYNWRTAPMIFINNEFIGGYDDIVDLHQRGELTKKLSL